MPPRKRHPFDRQVLGVRKATPPVRPRYIVLGLARDAEIWRRERGLGPREVIQVFAKPDRLRDVAGPIEVVRLPSWLDAPAPARRIIERHLQIIATKTASDGRDTGA